ncbi:hypothetical protein [Aquirufa rosea]|uniref:Prenyltransferase n=1 Tax=Aquirufa rosea TaxID=2509241 RepID=A0A4Q1C0P0_9BACT|nr:hypothetical protein [Aquirufa rosea]RXK49893.1 hypothetical protein ESB04_06895 [Aquirufa rosea]
MRSIRLAHWLSLDVVCGTLAYQALLHDIFLQQYPTWAELLSMACAVWGIYLIDRIIDRKKGIVLDQRHAFQAKYAHEIQIGLFVLGIIGSISVWNLDLRLIGWGLGLSGIMLVYWVLWYESRLPALSNSKEFITSLIYALGVGASTWYRIPWSWSIVSIGTLLFLLVLQNLGIYTMAESEHAGILGTADTWKRILLGAEMLFVILFLRIIINSHEKMAFLPFATTFALQIWIHYFVKDKLAYRIWGELAYCSPLLYFAYEFFSK